MIIFEPRIASFIHTYPTFHLWHFLVTSRCPISLPPAGLIYLFFVVNLFWHSHWFGPTCGYNSVVMNVTTSLVTYGTVTLPKC